MGAQEEERVIAEATYTKVSELAAAFEISLPTAKKWRDKPGFPGGKVGPWRHSAVETFLASTRRAASQTIGNIGDEMAAERLGELRERHRKLKLENDERESILVPGDEVRQEFAMNLLRVKERLEAIPDELQMEVPAEVRLALVGRWREKVRLILVEISNWGTSGHE